MEVRSHAKINWALRILGRRPDGYHDLETLFQTISLHDTLTIRESDELRLTCDDPSIPTDESNLILQAVRALGVPPVEIELTKRIPAEGGLGGGSSNAAATLVALAKMFGVDERALHEIALSIGSDVPFFLVGGTAYAMDDWIGALDRAIVMAQEEGHIDPAVDSKQLAFELNSLFFGANFAQQLREDERALEFATRAIETRLEGVRTTPSSSRRAASGRR